MHIALVDDHANLRMVLADSLRREGHHVVELSSGAELLAHVARKPPDVIVADVRLPDLSGPDAIERVRAMGVGSKAILITGDAERARDVAARLELVVLEKPFSLDRLRAALTKVE